MAWQPMRTDKSMYSFRKSDRLESDSDEACDAGVSGTDAPSSSTAAHTGA